MEIYRTAIRDYMGYDEKESFFVSKDDAEEQYQKLIKERIENVKDEILTDEELEISMFSGKKNLSESIPPKFPSTDVLKEFKIVYETSTSTEDGMSYFDRMDTVIIERKDLIENHSNQG